METETFLTRVFDFFEKNSRKEARELIKSEKNETARMIAECREMIEELDLEQAGILIGNVQRELQECKGGNDFKILKFFNEISICLLENAKNHYDQAHEMFKLIISEEENARFKGLARVFCARVCRKGIFSQAEEKERFLEIFNSSLNVTPNSTWHVVSAEWFLQWCAYVGAKQEEFNVKVPIVRAESRKRPGPIDNTAILEKINYQDYLQDPAHPSFIHTLKPGLSEGIDYLLLSSSAFEILGDSYGVNQDIIRHAIELNDTIYVIETYLKTVLIGYLSSKTLQVRKLSTSRKNTLSYIKKLVLQQQNLQSRVWKIDLTRLPTDRLKVLSLRTFTTYLNGSAVLDDQIILDDAEISESNLLLIEVNYKGKYIYSDDPSLTVKKCAFCQDSSQDVQCKQCKKKLYCNIECMERHGEEHKKSCKVKPKKSIFNLFSCFCRQTEQSDSEDERLPAQPIGKDTGKPMRIVGLQNLGNTCFMNSALQCLANVSELTRFFVSGDFKENINKSNNLGTGGKLANEYAEFLYCLSRTREKSIAPWKLKKTVSMFVTQFAGHQQHDSHEFLMFLISGLHEDLNRITKKPYYSDDVRESDQQQMSSEYWLRFLSRNKSFIVNQLYGQYKSTLVCPKCHGVSHTFDPFNCLSLPIPQLRSHKVSVKYVPSQPSLPALIFSFIIDESSNINALITKVVSCVKEKPSSLLCLDVGRNFIEEVDQESPINQLKSGNLFLYDCPEEFNRYVLVKFRSESYYSFECYPRIVKMEEDSTYEDLHKEVFGKFAEVCLNGEDKDNYLDFYNKQSYRMFYEPDMENLCAICRLKRCKGCQILNHEKKVSGYYKGKSFFSVVFNIAKGLGKAAEINMQKQSVSMKTIDLSVKRNVNIYDCFGKFREPETLDKNNEWFCPKCKNHVQAQKKLEVFKLPKILIIHLKRFRISGFSREKITLPVHFPLENLDLRHYISSDEVPPFYELFAVSNHFGALAGGHYTATVKQDQKWFDCNDSDVSEFKGTIDYSSAYVLFYRACSNQVSQL